MWWITLTALFASGFALTLYSAGSRAADPVPAVQADFTFAPAVPVVGDTVTFTSTSQATGIGNSITKYKWDLDGDNAYDADSPNAPSATHAYAARGALSVRLQVTDALGNKSTAKKTLTIDGHAPLVSFTYAPSAPRVNDPVTFSATASDPDGAVADLSWDLNGDGNFDNGRGTTALRSFPTSGSYAIGARATDNEGAATFYSQSVAVSALPVASTTAAPALRLISPFPVVRISGRLTPRGARVSLLVIDAAPGARVVVRCSGRGCPFKKRSRSAPDQGTVRAAGQLRLRSLERLLRSGIRVRIYVTIPGAIGKYTIFRIRSHAAPVRVDRCLMPGSWNPVNCPAA